jgi:DNA mismatch repair ATPase MutS
MEINGRLDLVTEILRNPSLRESLVNHLQMTFDTWRIMQKFAFGKGVVDDLISLARTIYYTSQIRLLLQSHVKSSNANIVSSGSSKCAVSELIDRLVLEKVDKVAEDILQAIDEDKLSEQHSIEDDETVATVQMAETILKEAGEDQMRGMPQRLKGKSSDVTKDKDNESVEDVWIMRPA